MKYEKSTLSVKGQVTIPQAVREKLGLRPGQVIEFEAKDGLLVGRKSLGASLLDEITGVLRGKVSRSDQYLDEIRGK